MTNKLMARSLLICVIMLMPLISSALDQRPLCPVCRRYADKSPQSCTALLLLGGRHPKQITACSLFCLFETLEQYEAEPELITIANYDTVGDDFVQQLNVIQATYLFEAKGDPELSHEPYIYAFANKDAAKAAQKELGGELLEWEAVRQRCIKLAANWEPEREDDKDSDIPYRRR